MCHYQPERSATEGEPVYQMRGPDQTASKENPELSHVHLRKAGVNVGTRESRQDRVRRLRVQIASGVYRVSLDMLAECMMQRAYRQRVAGRSMYSV